MKYNNSKKYKISTLICSMVFTLIACSLFVRAGDLNPTSGPADTMETLDDIYCRQLYDCTTTSYGTDSPASPASTMHTLQEIYDQIPYFLGQKNATDDRYCVNNNGTASSTCAANDPEYVKEEAFWSTSTDSTPPTNLLSSGLVFKDMRTGLYWSSPSTSTMSNSFGAVSTQCTDNEVSDGTCDPCTWATKGNAIATCCGLDLDCSANGCSSSTDWRLPTQKELIQILIDGAINNFDYNTQTLWSSTEYSSDSTYADYYNLNFNQVLRDLKTTLYNVRCVRP
jgi:hypothetical protein